MCGVIGIKLVESKLNLGYYIYTGLNVLQHRGQDAVGLVLSDGKINRFKKRLGLVQSLNIDDFLVSDKEFMGLGHLRYTTHGKYKDEDAIQPFYVNYPYGICLVHNGNLVNANEVKEYITKVAKRQINTSSDSEILVNVLAHKLANEDKKEQSMQDKIINALKSVYKLCEGSFSCVAMIADVGMIAWRDSYGIRPLSIGRKFNKSKNKYDYMFASESIAFSMCGFNLWRSVKPGEVIFVDLDSNFYSFNIAPKGSKSCIFEYIYFARPDSIIDDILVYDTRVAMGKVLAKVVKAKELYKDIDYVMPIPETSIPTAMALAKELNLDYKEGFIKNRYIGRTFIMPECGNNRKQYIKLKLNVVSKLLKGKNIILVDDSIVRGNTSKEIINMARSVGVNKIIFISAAPPIKYTNIYGIDMATKKELIANKKNTKEIANFMGVDKLIYMSLSDLKAAINSCHNEQIDRDFESSIFDGNYVTGDYSEAFLNKLSEYRNKDRIFK